MKKYALLLNAGFNIATIEDSLKKQKFHWQRGCNSKIEEAFQYLLTFDEDTVEQLPPALHFLYSGAFPVYTDTAMMYAEGDGKGNIALDGHTLRASEQSVWYPMIYDKKNDIIVNKYTYSITVACEDGTSIYVNGDVPKSVKKNIFSSASLLRCYCSRAIMHFTSKLVFTLLTQTLVQKNQHS